MQPHMTAQTVYHPRAVISLDGDDSDESFSRMTEDIQNLSNDLIAATLGSPLLDEVELPPLGTVSVRKFLRTYQLLYHTRIIRRLPNLPDACHVTQK